MSETLLNGDWWLSTSRSNIHSISLLKQCLPTPDIVSSEAVDDCYMWKIGDAILTAKFSTAQTWRYLNPPEEEVAWHSSVWFFGRIPKHSFITWVPVWNRMATHDRLRNWGVEVSSICVLCTVADETRQHIFFDCPFSHAVWTHFTSKAGVVPPTLFEDSVCWLKTASRDKNLLLILKLLFQAAVYIYIYYGKKLCEDLQS